jgi:hypothetical protein
MAGGRMLLFIIVEGLAPQLMLARGGRYRSHWSRVGCYHSHYRLLLGLAGGNDVRL